MDFLNRLSKEQRDIADKVIAAARKYGVPENIALGMAMQESSFDQSKSSGVGPRGVMGVGIRASKDLKIDPKNVDQNIDGGMRYFKQQLDRTGNIDAALVAYHDGPNSDFFKGGSMSPAAANHIQKVKGYAGMANDTTKKDSNASFSVDVEDIEPAAQFENVVEPSGGEARGYEDVASALGGAGVGYGVGKNRQMSFNQKALNLRAQALAQRQQQAAYAEAQRAAEANRPPSYGSGTENWKNTEYGEPIARQINQPVSKSQAVTEADAAIARHNKAKQLFPSQVPASPGSQLTIPLTLGGKTAAPMQPPTTAAQAPVSAPPIENMPAMRTLNAPGRGSTLATTGFGALAGAQGYDTYRKLMERDWSGAGRSGLATLEALIAAGSRKPIVKALAGGVSAATSFGPELMDYLKSGEEVPAKAEGGMIHMAGGGLAPHGLRHSGEGAKGKGYFGMMPSQDIGEGPVDYSLAAQPHSTEISLEDDDIGEYPSLVPGLTKEEMDHLLAGHEPTESIIQKARMHAMSRKQKGMNPFAQPDELHYPVPHYGVGGIAKKGIQTILSDLADRYPSLIPGILKKDVKTGKEFVGKALSPEEMALQKARNAAQKEIDKGNYQPFFDVSQRAHVDPANYPMRGATITEALPKQAKTKEKWAQQFDTPEIAARLREAYGKAKDDPLTHNWYAMGQLEQEFIKELGPEMGRKMFRERFAEPMAATTGGADPTANLLSAYYGNYMRQAGTPMGAASHELPHPIGGRYIMGNLDQYNKVINQGAGLTTATPKRFNFASDFMGHQDRPTLDEQMTGIFDPKLAAPPGDSYGVMEAVLNKAAAAEGVSPVNFQEVAWAGKKGTKGKPMIQHVNEAIERTARVTGKTPEEVLRDSIIHARSPLYGGAAVGLGGLDQYENRR